MYFFSANISAFLSLQAHHIYSNVKPQGVTTPKWFVLECTLQARESSVPSKLLGKITRNWTEQRRRKRSLFKSVAEGHLFHDFRPQPSWCDDQDTLVRFLRQRVYEMCSLIKSKYAGLNVFMTCKEKKKKKKTLWNRACVPCYFPPSVILRLDVIVTEM